jgi:hypothetical protein
MQVDVTDERRPLFMKTSNAALHVGIVVDRIQHAVLNGRKLAIARSHAACERTYARGSVVDRWYDTPALRE